MNIQNSQLGYQYGGESFSKMAPEMKKSMALTSNTSQVQLKDLEDDQYKLGKTTSNNGFNTMNTVTKSQTSLHQQSNPNKAYMSSSTGFQNSLGQLSKPGTGYMNRRRRPRIEDYTSNVLNQSGGNMFLAASAS